MWSEAWTRAQVRVHTAPAAEVHAAGGDDGDVEMQEAAAAAGGAGGAGSGAGSGVAGGSAGGAASGGVVDDEPIGPPVMPPKAAKVGYGTRILS